MSRTGHVIDGRPLRICLVSSAGGHTSQLLRLADSWAGMDCFFVTTSEAVRPQLEQFGPVYVVDESNRKRLIRFFKALADCRRIVLKEKPTVVISTGAAVGCIVAFWAKLRGAQVVWVDSIANVERLSLSGRLTRPFADLVLTQWPDIAQRYRSVEYVGNVV